MLRCRISNVWQKRNRRIKGESVPKNAFREIKTKELSYIELTVRLDEVFTRRLSDGPIYCTRIVLFHRVVKFSVQLL